MRYFSEQNLGKISFFGSVCLVVILTSALGGMHIYSGYRTLDADILFFEKTFLEHRKEYLKLTVDEQIGRIEIRHKLVMEELNRSLKARAQNVVDIMENLYEQYRETKTREEIEQLLREALRPLRFQGGSGYVFIRSLNGVPQLYPPDPTVEGDLSGFVAISDSKKNAGEIAQIIRDKGEGFYTYQWPKSGTDLGELYQKLSFVTHFKPFDWVVGAEDYIDFLDKKVRQGVMTVLKESSASNEGGYYFLYQLQNIQGGNEFATMLVNVNRPDLVGTVLSDSFTDVKGKMFRKEILKGLREDGEAFVEYWYKKPGSEEISRKLSYFKLYPQWNWVLARGVYFDDLETVIALKRKQLAEQLEQDLLMFLMVIIAALVVALVLASYFSEGIHDLFEQYKKKQQYLQRKLEHSRDELELRVQSRTAELEEMHTQLLHSEKLAAIGSFSASIAHEFNNPLTGIVNVFSRLRRTLKLAESDKRLTDMALNECSRMQRLILDMQSFNRPSSGRKSNFELRITIESILLLSKKELSLCHIEVETDFSPVSTIVHAIEDQIKQVLLNLIKNAMEAMSVTGGILTIATKREGQIVRVDIHDNGSGINAEYLGQIYDPFFTTKSTVKGTGLGLSVSYNIIKGHGGDITVTSHPGEGTTFVLSLPAATGI